MTGKIPLTQQIDEVRLAHTRALTLKAGQTFTEKRPKDVVARSADTLAAALRTLEWMHQNEDAIRSWHASHKPEGIAR